jgi:hypothetical protein
MCQVRAVHAAAAVHQDGVGMFRGSHRQWTSPSGYMVEEGDGEGRAVAAGGGDRRTGEGSKKCVQATHGDGSGLAEQFIEQVVCVLRAESPGANTLRGGSNGGVWRTA